jgi:hypothetical protein
VPVDVGENVVLVVVGDLVGARGVTHCGYGKGCS